MLISPGSQFSHQVAAWRCSIVVLVCSFVLLLHIESAGATGRQTGPVGSSSIATPISIELDGENEWGLIVEKNVLITMRDGVRLATDIYRPAVEDRVPVVLIRTPYGSETRKFAERGLFFVKHGYALAVQDVRGKYDSEGDWWGIRDEAKDGDDTITWLGTQPWSSGNVGMTGSSYMGMVQYWVADQQNPYLKALVPFVAPVTLGRDTDDYNYLTVYSARESYSNNLGWMILTDGRVNQADSNTPQVLKKARSHLPRIDYPRILGRDMQWWSFLLDIRYGFWEEFYLRASRGNWSGSIELASWYGDYKERYKRVDVPVLHVSGWWDCCAEQIIKNFQLMSQLAVNDRARNNQKLVMGPWEHGVGGTTYGDHDYGPLAKLDPDELAIQWFDRWLKGIDNGVESTPPVRAFVMGENRWREAKDWPLPGTEFTKYYLNSNGDARLKNGGGELTAKPGASQGSDHYVYDPGNPTPGDGELDETFEPVGRDLTPRQLRDDVLIYTTPPLDASVEVTGPLSAVIYFSTSAPSTDLILRLVDVHPDGKAYSVFNTSTAIPYRSHWSDVSETKADGSTIIRAEMILPPTSIVFKTGHRIRVSVSSAAAPVYRGLNVEPGTEATAMTWNIARQEIIHDESHPSHIVLPVISSIAEGGDNEH